MTTAIHHDLLSPRIEERLRAVSFPRPRSTRFASSLIALTATCFTIASSLTTPIRAGFVTGRLRTPSLPTSCSSSRSSRTSSWSRPCCG